MDDIHGGDGVFPIKNQPAIGGTPMTMESPTWKPWLPYASTLRCCLFGRSAPCIKKTGMNQDQKAATSTEFMDVFKEIYEDANIYLYIYIHSGLLIQVLRNAASLNDSL